MQRPFPAALLCRFAAPTVPGPACPARFLRGHASARNKYAAVLGFHRTKPKDRRIYNGPYRNLAGQAGQGTAGAASRHSRERSG